MRTKEELKLKNKKELRGLIGELDLEIIELNNKLSEVSRIDSERILNYKTAIDELNKQLSIQISKAEGLQKKETVLESNNARQATSIQELRANLQVENIFVTTYFKIKRIFKR